MKHKPETIGLIIAIVVGFFSLSVFSAQATKSRIEITPVAYMNLPIIVGATATPQPSPTPIPSPTPEPTPPNPFIYNPSFEDENWETVELGNQAPDGWDLNLVPIGAPLFSETDYFAGGQCECIHKYNWQLPPNEQLGGPDALILEGQLTYKIFSTNSFGTELRQETLNVPVGSTWRVTIPVRIHKHQDFTDWSAASRVIVNGEILSDWVWDVQAGDRTWYEHQVEFFVPDDGVVDIQIQFMSRLPIPRDFFIDHIRAEFLGWQGE